MIAETDPRKKEELKGMILSAFAASGEVLDEDCAAIVLDHLVSITPPQGNVNSDLVVIGIGGGEQALSIKPGNIVLNMRRLVTAIANGVLIAVGVAQAPWTAIFGAIVLWESLYVGAQVDLSEREAAVIWTLWIHRDPEQTSSGAGLLEAVNVQRAKYDRSPISQTELEAALKNLERIGSIERSLQNPSRWWLRERVKVTYF